MDILKSIDIALGMIVVYLTFALGVTAFNEAIAAWLKSRAKWLRVGIEALLTTASNNNSQDISKQKVSADDFYSSPFIRFLGDQSNKTSFQPSYVAPWILLQGLLDAANEKNGQIKTTIQGIATAADKLPESSPIRAVVFDLLARAEEDLEQFRKLFEEWFQSFEGQVNAWYRQKTQYVIVALSVLLVSLVNLDTIALFRQLSSDTKVRDALVLKALETAKKDKLDDFLDRRGLTQETEALAQIKKELEAAEVTLREASGTQAQNVIDEAKKAVDAKRSAVVEGEKKITAEQKKYEDAGVNLTKDISTRIQVGWIEEDGRRLWKAEGFDLFQNWISKLIGLMLSAAALSLGAPFWFDLLKKVASIRSVGLDLSERAAKAAKSAGG